MASQTCPQGQCYGVQKGGCYEAAGCVPELLRVGTGLAAFIDQNASVLHGTMVQMPFRSRELGEGAFLLKGNCH